MAPAEGDRKVSTSNATGLARATFSVLARCGRDVRRAPFARHKTSEEAVWPRSCRPSRSNSAIIRSCRVICRSPAAMCRSASTRCLSCIAPFMKPSPWRCPTSSLFRFIEKQDAEHLRHVREVIARSRELLKKNPAPDTFAGRKTQEPFPQPSDDEALLLLNSPRRNHMPRIGITDRLSASIGD